MNNQFIQRVIFNWDKIDNNSYLKKIEAFKGIERLDFNKPVTFFVGENGSGKSTLLEALAVAYGFNPEGGTKNYVFSTYDTHSELYDAITISRGHRKEKWGYFLRAESFYNVATQEEEYADASHPSAKYHKMSHGESFLALAQNNLRAEAAHSRCNPHHKRAVRVPADTAAEHTGSARTAAVQSAPRTLRNNYPERAEGWILHSRRRFQNERQPPRAKRTCRRSNAF